MKVRNDFILRSIADDNLLIPTGEAALSIKGLIALSESGALLFQKLQAGCTKEDLLAAMLEEYDVSAEEAASDIDAFLNRMRELNMLVEDAHGAG